MEGADDLVGYDEVEGADDGDRDNDGVDDAVGIIVEAVGVKVKDVGDFVDMGLLVEVNGLFEESFDGLFEETYSYEEGGFPKRSNAFKLYLCTRSLSPIASWRSARAMTADWYSFFIFFVICDLDVK